MCERESRICTAQQQHEVWGDFPPKMYKNIFLPYKLSFGRFSFLNCKGADRKNTQLFVIQRTLITSHSFSYGILLLSELKTLDHVTS